MALQVEPPRSQRLDSHRVEDRTVEINRRIAFFPSPPYFGDAEPTTVLSSCRGDTLRAGNY